MDTDVVIVVTVGTLQIGGQYPSVQGDSACHEVKFKAQALIYTPELSHKRHGEAKGSFIPRISKTKMKSRCYMMLLLKK